MANQQLGRLGKSKLGLEESLPPMESYFLFQTVGELLKRGWRQQLQIGEVCGPSK